MKLKTKLFSIISIILYVLPFSTLADTDISSELDPVLQGTQRSAKNVARDIYRHPKETLTFFGLQPNMQVLEILPGRGWYTEILAPLLNNDGLLTVASFGEQNAQKYLRNIHIQFMQKINADPETYGKVKVVLFEQEASYLQDIPAGSMDMILTFRNTHNWIRFGGIKEIYTAFHQVLKPGGILGVVQHRAHGDADHKVSAEKGYVPEKYLINLIEQTGFELVKKSNINNNTVDSKDYPEGVWSLPPSLREGDKEHYLSIGESDRMTLKFVKLQ